MPATGNIRIYPGALDAILATDPRADELVKSKAVEVMEAAKAVFLARQRSDNEERKSEFTPPKYISSFEVNKISRLRGLAWEVRNTDPGATLVEYGAQAGGRTYVLRYKPLTVGLEIVGGGG
jgi:hypothetical protein